MQNKWYGDKRDLVKWGTLIHLASGNPPARILQVLMLRPDDERDSLLIEYNPQGDTQYPISVGVFDHFRRVQNITSLRPDIRVFDAPFPPNGDDGRNHYFTDVCNWVRRQRCKRLVVLADPDTGIGPINREYNHIDPEELRRLYGALKEGDTLVLYQHKQRYRRDWLDATLREFANAIRVQRNRIRTFQCQLAGDVALFAVNKRRSK